eukprot:6193324-Pleurochrysis_carterae.AAC.1
MISSLYIFCFVGNLDNVRRQPTAENQITRPSSLAPLPVQASRMAAAVSYNLLLRVLPPPDALLPFSPLAIAFPRGRGS